MNLDPLLQAVRDQCEHLHRMAVLSLAARAPQHPALSNDLSDDWLSYVSIRERRVIEAAMAAGVWSPS